MDNITKIDLVDIELNSGSLHRSWLNHSIGSADAKANAFGVRVFRDGQPVTLSGGSVQGYFRDSQGNNIALTSQGTIDGNAAYVTLPQACYNYDGQFTLAIKLINSSLGITGTMRIVDGMVDNTNTGSTVAPTGTVPTYQEVLSVYENMVECLEDFDEYKDGIDAEVDELKSELIQSQLNYIVCESGTYQDPHGAWKVANNTRIRNISPVYVGDIESITIPSGYEMWIFRYNDKFAPIGNIGAWKSGKVNISDIVTSGTRFINFAIKNSSTPSSDISSEVGTVQNGIVISFIDDVLYNKLDSAVFHGNKRNGSLGESGNIVLNYPMLVGHSYHYKNTSENDCVQVVHTTSRNSTDSAYHIENINRYADPLSKGLAVDFSPSQDGAYLHIYMNAAGSFELYENSTSEHIYNKLGETNNLLLEESENIINGLSSVLNDAEYTEICFVFEKGGLSTSTGVETNSVYNLRSKKYHISETTMIRFDIINTSNTYYAIKFNSNGSYSTYYSITNGREIAFDADTYLRILIVTNTEISVEDISQNIKISIKNQHPYIAKNMIGNTAGKLYPNHIVSGDVLTISTSDGSLFSASEDLKLECVTYDGAVTTWYSLPSTASQRTVTFNAYETFYLRLNVQSAVPLMVNRGGVKEIYQPYEEQIMLDDNYDNIVKSVCRIADGMAAPAQSIEGYKLAKRWGLNCLLCDLRFTSDNVPVLIHDDYPNQTANNVYNDNGTIVEDTTPYSELSYSQLQAYDFGFYKANAYKGTRVLTLEQMLNLCKKIGCEIYLEEKVDPTPTQFGIVFGLIKQYGMFDKVIWSPQTVIMMNHLVAYEPNVKINLHSNLLSGEAISDTTISALIACVNDYNRGYNTITLTYGATITAEQVKTMAENGIGIMATTLNSASEIIAYYNQGKPYTSFSEVLTNSVNAGKVLFENAMT